MDFIGRAPFAHHAQTLLLKLPYIVLHALTLLQKFIEFVIEGTALHTLAHVINQNAHAAILKHYGHHAFASHKELSHNYRIHIATKAELAMHYLA